jgi:hypothetical protein
MNLVQYNQKIKINERNYELFFAKKSSLVLMLPKGCQMRSEDGGMRNE